MSQVVISTCGTSVLTNGADRDLAGAIIRNSNLANPWDLANHAIREQIQAHVAERWDVLIDSTPAEAARMSAEINGILHLYPQGLDPQDHYFLISSNTWLGSESARIVAGWIKKAALNVQVVEIPDLRTDNVNTFHKGLSELVKWCSETLPDYRSSGLRVIFNLTGGFKSVQGFMQTLSHFYADEAVYVFEGGMELLRLPGLPVELKLTDTVRDYLMLFRRLDRQLPLTQAELAPILDTFIFHIQDEPGVVLSAWGELVYRANRGLIYGERLWESPSPKISYGPVFESSLAGLNGDQIRQINERIDDLAACLELGKCSDRLNLSPIHGKFNHPSTHEIYAWSGGKVARILGHHQGELFVLDTFDD